MAKKYIFTNHLINRIRERFNFNWNWDNKWEIYKKLETLLANSKEDKSYINDIKFVFYLQDLYGIDVQYEFRANREHNILFVIVDDRGRGIVKTCYPLNSSRFVSRKQYTKKESQKRYTPKSKRKRQVLNELEAMEEHLMENSNGRSVATFG